MVLERHARGCPAFSAETWLCVGPPLSPSEAVPFPLPGHYNNLHLRGA